MQLLFTITTVYCSLLTTYNCFGINLIDVKQDINASEETTEKFTTCSATESTDTTSRVYPPIRTTVKNQKRRFMIVTPIRPVFRQAERFEDEKDKNLKNKISMLVQQSIHDAKLKMKTVDNLKEKYKDDPSYRVGFIFSNLKKSKDIMSELFNVAVKHRHDWKALEQMKIFELIVHTNVDTTNLVRQLVEIHLQNLNSTDPVAFRKRVVLL
ncbi:unnamed protein product, partial [Iphiclides podalirius]